MKAFALPVLVSAIVALASFSPPSAHADGVAPYETIRALQNLQSRIASGEKGAFTSQTTLMAHIVTDFSAAAPDVWKDPKNARAVVTFILSGGDVSVLTKIIGEATAPADFHGLMNATLAYAQGREAEAKQLFATIDPRTLVDSLGGQVALVEATLILADNRQRAIELLDYARLTMPGSLVEEAALRREIFLFGEVGDVTKFISLSQQYIRRFRHSTYADNFLQGFVAAVTRFGLTVDVTKFGQIEDLLVMLGPGDERQVLLVAAAAAAAGGKLPTALSAAKKAEGLTSQGSVDQSRARLYQAAAMVVTNRYDDGMAALKSMGSMKLPQQDGDLHDAVADLAVQLRTMPKAPDAAPPALPATASKAAAAAPLATAAATVQSAQKALAAVDSLLGVRAP